MANQYFSIKEQLFDIQFTNRSLVHELQNRVSRLTNDRLIPEMNNSLEKIIPENLIIKFDSIALDIGDIDYDSLEEELVPKIIQSLEEQLEIQIRLLKENKYAASEGSISVQNIAGNEELLEYFLVNGVLPWWAQMNNGVSLDGVVRELFGQNPSGLRALIMRIGQNEYVRKRLVFQFDEDSIHKIIQVLEPSEAAYIIGYHKEVVAVQQKEQLVQAEMSAFAKAVWLFIITYLLEDRGSDFNRKAFVKSTLVQMAAWFNVNYYELLKLFYEAVVISVEHDRYIISLETFIRELTVEEEMYHETQLPGTNYTQPESVPSKNAEQLLRKADLVMYYLLHGSLPPGANGYSNELLAEMLHELVLHIPETIRSLLAGLEQDTDSAKRYFELTRHQRGKELLQKLYPQSARLLITFSSLVELIQAKKQLLGIEISGLDQTLTRILIRILFSANKNDDDFILLGQYIKQLSAQFGKEEQQLIQGIHAAVQEEFRQGIMNSNLPALISRLSEQLASPVKDGVLIDKKSTDNIDAVEEKGLKDTLIYLLQYGHIPWWGKRFFEKETTDVLFRKLLQSSPNEMLQLLRIAGNEPRLQKRFLSFVSLSTLLDSIILLPIGEKAIEAIKLATHWFEQGIGVMEGADSVIRKIIFHSAWDEMINAMHQSFSATGFYTRTVLRLAAHLTTTAEIVVNTFIKGLAMETDSTVYHAEKEILDTIIHLLDMEMLPAIETKPGAAKNTGSIADIESLRSDPFIQKVLARLPDDELSQVLSIISAKRHPRRPITSMQVIQRSSPVVKQEAINEAKEILRYFLVWKRLPDDIRIGEYKSVDAFIKQMILLVYSIDQAALSSLVKEEQYIRSAAYAFNKLFDVYKGGEEKQLSILFDNLLVEKAAATKEAVDNISAEHSEAEIEQETIIKKLITATIPAAQKISRELLATEALKIIEYFFEWNRLPDHWREQTDLSMPVILKQLFMILYKENTVLIQRLLQNQTHAVSPRVYFHELVSVAEGGIEKEAALFMQPYKEMYLQKQFALSKQAKIIQLEKETGEDYTKTRSVDTIIMTVPKLVEWIDQFLSGAGLPKTAGQPVATDEKLVKMVIQLYSLDQQALKQVLAKEDHLASARIRLHDLFITHTGYQERVILQLLQQYWQKDLLSLLAAGHIDIDQSKPGDFARILLHFIESGKRTQRENELWQLAISSPLFIRYLTIDAGQQVLKTFIEKTGVGWGEEVVDYMEAMRGLFRASIPNNLERDKLLSLLLQFNLLFLSGRLSVRSRDEYLQAFFSYTMQAAHTIPVTVFVGVLQFIRQKNIPATNILTASIDILQTELQELIYRLDHRLLQKKEWERNEDVLANEEKERKRLLQLEAIRTELEKERILEEERRKKESEKSEDEKRNKIYIRNAGMVLLHPFLGTYFSRLGLTEQGKFVDEPSQQRAVLLLQYLVNGRNVSEEFELALNKILCGLDIGATVPLEIALTETEITMSAELFQVVFQRWEKMKNTSVEGFRASFLQREGALTRGQENWELRVEQRTYDMLLDTLPWSFGMIKNTWMNQLLTVEWM